jgi:hypothetical protein
MSAISDTTTKLPSTASSGPGRSARTAEQSSKVSFNVLANWYGKPEYSKVVEDAKASRDLHAPYSSYDDIIDSGKHIGIGRFPVQEDGTWGLEIWDETRKSFVPRPDLTGKGTIESRLPGGDVGRPVCQGIDKAWLMIGDECSQKEVLGQAESYS